MMTDDTQMTDEQADVRMVLLAFLRDGEYAAEQTENFVKLWTKSLGLKKLPNLPAEFLLELSAVLRIAAWQQAGLATEMQAEFPPAQELLRELVERLRDHPESFSLELINSACPLTDRVAQLWFRNCSWSATSELGVDVVLRRPNRELLRDLLAELLGDSQGSCRSRRNAAR